jgi:hypothetical protein
MGAGWERGWGSAREGGEGGPVGAPVRLPPRGTGHSGAGACGAGAPAQVGAVHWVGAAGPGAAAMRRRGRRVHVARRRRPCGRGRTARQVAVAGAAPRLLGSRNFTRCRAVLRGPALTACRRTAAASAQCRARGTSSGNGRGAPAAALPLAHPGRSSRWARREPAGRGRAAGARAWQHAWVAKRGIMGAGRGAVDGAPRLRACGTLARLPETSA